MFTEAKLLGGLGLVAALLFAYQWQIHKAVERGRDECRIAAARELKENTDDIARIANNAQAKRDSLAADALRARAAADRLRGSVGGSGLVVRPAAAAASAPAFDTGVVPPDLLELAVRLAGLADQRGAAGDACERAYDAVRR